MIYTTKQVFTSEKGCIMKAMMKTNVFYMSCNTKIVIGVHHAMPLAFLVI